MNMRHERVENGLYRELRASYVQRFNLVATYDAESQTLFVGETEVLDLATFYYFFPEAGEVYIVALPLYQVQEINNYGFTAYTALRLAGDL